MTLADALAFVKRRFGFDLSAEFAANEAGAVVAPTPDPDPTGEGARLFMIESFKRAHPGQPIPQWLARTSTQAARRAPDPPNALKELQTQVETLGAELDEWAASKGLRFVVVPDEPVYAAPQSPWLAAHEEAGPDQDGAARGDEGVIRRRQLQELHRKLRSLTFADREGRAGDALREEIETLLQAEREDRQRRNFGTGEPGSFGQPTGA